MESDGTNRDTSPHISLFFIGQATKVMMKMRETNIISKPKGERRALHKLTHSAEEERPIKW